MSLFVVDAERCNGDGICLRVCSKELLHMGDDGIPVMPADNEKKCGLCGHCMAFCPKGAITLHAPSLPAEPIQTVDAARTISPEQAEQFLKSRRSVRNFLQKPVDRSAIERILATARMAHSGGNNQLVQWIVVEKSSDVQHLAGLVAEWFDSVARHDPMLSKRYAIDGILKRFHDGKDLILRGAPHMAIAITPEQAAWGAVDSAIALTYFELAAHSLGVGTCWAGYFTKAATSYDPIRKYLGLEEGMTVQGAVVFGNNAYRSHQIPVRNALRVKWL